MALPMHFKQILNCLFFGYLVLLLNLGSSLHHAHFFGLHVHHGTTSATDPDIVGEQYSCCCHGHSHFATPSSGQSGSIHANHDCAFCKFFDQYHVTIDAFDFQQRVRAIEFQPLRKTIFVFAAILNPNARGPPSAA